MSPPPIRLSNLLAAAALGFLAGCGEGGGGRAAGAEDARSSVLLVTFDTTRADALGCYGGDASVTPNLDRLAAEGVLFERAYTCVPLTLPAHATMLSGLYPIRTGVRHNSLRPLPQASETLAERASEAGYQTAAVVGAIVLSADFGLAQGFDLYDVPAEQTSGSTAPFDERPAAEVVDRALAWLRARDRSRPFFLWVHLFDPHQPRLAPPGYRDDRYPNLYLGEVAYADAQLGRLVDALRDERVLDETAVMFVADHGEAFGEHREPAHGLFCYEPTLRVPMILRHPDRARAGARVGGIVSVADVYPTLLAAMGLAARPGIDGVDLYRTGPEPTRGVYFESYYAYVAYGWSPLAGWMDAAGKYVHSSTPEFYDVAADPLEARNLVGERELRPYRDAIAELAALPTLPTGAAAGGLDAELQQRIRALGYAGVEHEVEGFPHPLSASDRPSPSERANEYDLANRAMEFGRAGKWREAEALWRTVLGTDPDNLAALEQVSSARIQLGDYAGAIAPLQRLLSDGSERPSLHYNLGISLWQVGRLEEAIARLRRARELVPDEPRVREGLIGALRAAGRHEEADALK